MNVWLDLFRRWYQSIIVCAAVLAFAIQPLLRFYAPGSLLNVGICFIIVAVGFAVIRGHVAELDKPEGRPHAKGSIANIITATVVAFLVAAVLFISATSQATRDLHANEARCLAIQHDMLSSMPLRSDDPDLFQALGCRPQGGGSVYAERDTKDDADAMIEQSARRSELPYRNPYRGDGSGAVLK